MRLQNLIKDYAEKKGLDYEVAYVIIMGTWKELQVRQTEMRQLYLRMIGLGTFNMKHWRLDELIEKWSRAYEKRPDTYALGILEQMEYAKELKRDEMRKKNAHWEYRRSWEHEQNRNKAQQDQSELTNNKEDETNRDTKEGVGE